MEEKLPPNREDVQRIFSLDHPIWKEKELSQDYIEGYNDAMKKCIQILRILE